MPNIEPFENYSDAYDEWFVENAALYEAELEAVRRALPPAEAEGMEVGVGSGKFALPLGIGLGVEPSEKMADRAREQGIEVHAGVAEALPFPEGRFDFVLFVTTICFVDDVGLSFKEAFRVLKTGGCVIVGFVDKESEIGKQYAAKKDKSRFYNVARFFSTREVLGHLKEAGFEIGDVRQTLIPGESPNTILYGSGRGAFVVIKGVK